MAIKEVISSGMSPVEPLRKSTAKTEEQKPAASADRVDLSEEARSLLESGQSRRMEEILERVRSGYYNKPEVVNKIVDEILKDLRGTRG